MTALLTLQDLTATESAFLATMQQLGFGRFEYLQVRDGQLVLDPRPTAVRDIKFASAANPGKPADTMQALCPQVAEFFSQVRKIAAGEIRQLIVRHGIPFSMELELTGAAQLVEGGGRG